MVDRERIRRFLDCVLSTGNELATDVSFDSSPLDEKERQFLISRLMKLLYPAEIGIRSYQTGKFIDEDRRAVFDDR